MRICSVSVRNVAACGCRACDNPSEGRGKGQGTACNHDMPTLGPRQGGRGAVQGQLEKLFTAGQGGGGRLFWPVQMCWRLRPLNVESPAQRVPGSQFTQGHVDALWWIWSQGKLDTKIAYCPSHFGGNNSPCPVGRVSLLKMDDHTTCVLGSACISMCPELQHVCLAHVTCLCFLDDPFAMCSARHQEEGPRCCGPGITQT